MNSLIKKIAYDLNIPPFENESEGSFGSRVIYTALGQWCLFSALGESMGRKGISKNSQSRVVHELAEKYCELCPDASSYLFPSKIKEDISVFIRKFFEQTGYLLTQEDNFNILNQRGETVRCSDTDHLYLGIPREKYNVNGLGIHIAESKTEISLSDFLVRDDLDPERFLAVNFDECDFDLDEIDTEGLEYFNPEYFGNENVSWNRTIKSDMTIARRWFNGPFYKVIRKEDGRCLYKEFETDKDWDDLTGLESYRIYAALKYHSDNPMQVLLCPIDNEYTHLKLLGWLPNREYFYLLLNAWPMNYFRDRRNFIIRNKLTEKTVDVLRKIGFTSRNGVFYG